MLVGQVDEVLLGVLIVARLGLQQLRECWAALRSGAVVNER